MQVEVFIIIIYPICFIAFERIRLFKITRFHMKYVILFISHFKNKTNQITLSL